MCRGPMASLHQGEEEEEVDPGTESGQGSSGLWLGRGGKEAGRGGPGSARRLGGSHASRGGSWAPSPAGSALLTAALLGTSQGHSLGTLGFQLPGPQTRPRLAPA